MQVNYPTRNRPLVKTTIVVITCTTKLTVQYWDALSPCPNKGKEIHMCAWAWAHLVQCSLTY